MEALNNMSLAGLQVADVNALKQLLESFFKVGVTLEQQIDLEALAQP